MKKKICVVLPCYLVRNTILQVYKKIKKIKKIDLLIFVDDNCPQKSVSFLKSQLKKEKKKGGGRGWSNFYFFKK